MDSQKESKKWFTWPQIVAIASFTLSATTYIARQLTNEIPQELAWGAGFVMVVCVIFLVQRWILFIVKKLQPHLVAINPWLVTVVLVLCILILYHILPNKKAVNIGFDAGTCAVYNSWQHQQIHTKYLLASGDDETFAWHIKDGGSSGMFYFKTDPNTEPSIGASSGGYITFYRKPCDRLQFRKLCFRCKATDVIGTPDVGVRLSVDNPKLAGDRELITYEIGSIIGFSEVDESWHSFEIPLSDFKQVRYDPPFPNGLDENTINKIVFFVDNRIANMVSKATLCFSDIRFEP